MKTVAAVALGKLGGNESALNAAIQEGKVANPVRADLTLSTGRVVHHSRMPNGATSA